MRQKVYQTNSKQPKQMLISGEDLRKATKNRSLPSFSTGKYMSEKDRPRKKRWSMDEW